MRPLERPYIVGIVGGSASGKTTFIHRLAEHFDAGELCVISQDNYYVPKEQQSCDENGEINFDLPSSINRSEFHRHLTQLLAGEEIYIREYTFNNPDKEPGLLVFKPAPIIIMEGLFVFHYEEIRELLDLKIFIDADEDIKLERRIHRDAHERGYPKESVLYQWYKHVTPAFEQYLLPYKKHSDIIVTNNTSFDRGLEVLVHHLKAQVKWKTDSVL
jgi:uridine kinase